MSAHADEKIGHIWIEAWNSRDLDRILSLYDDQAEMTSAGIVRLGINAQGFLQGKDKLRAYWSAALERLPDLHFELLDVSVSPNSLVVRYRNERRQMICEYLRLNGEGKIVQGSANHLLS